LVFILPICSEHFEIHQRLLFPRSSRKTAPDP
jgi:hypothetical protein